MAAIRALEARSLEFMQEKEEKKRLEQVCHFDQLYAISIDCNSLRHSSHCVLDLHCLADIDADESDDSGRFEVTWRRERAWKPAGQRGEERGTRAPLVDFV
jgi:hypothetical protein